MKTIQEGPHRGRVGARSDPGQKRKNNQDSILIMGLPNDRILIAVADGVGGERGGEVASAAAIAAVRGRIQAAGAGRPDAELVEAANAANLAVWQQSQHDERLRGMATTLVAAVVRDGEAWLANVGDSRAYLIDGATLTQLTEDHSLVAERMREGGISEDEARQSRARHVITRSIGTEESVEVDTFGPIAPPPGSRLLLCSDGLTDVVPDDEIVSIGSSGTPEQAARALVDAANGHGGPDNISVILWQAG